MDIVVECKDKASLLIQRNTHTHTVQPHTSGNYPTYTHNAVNGLSTTKPSCPWFWHENTERLTHYTRGRDLVMEQMRSPKVPVKDLRGLLVCLWRHRSWFEPPLNSAENSHYPRRNLFNLNQLWIRAAFIDITNSPELWDSIPDAHDWVKPEPWKFLPSLIVSLGLKYLNQ